MPTEQQCTTCSHYKSGAYGKKCSYYGRTPNFDNTNCGIFNEKIVIPKNNQDDRDRIISEEYCDRNSTKSNVDATKLIILGIVAFLLGVGITIGTYLAHSQTFIIAHGAIIAGLAATFAGISIKFKNHNS